MAYKTITDLDLPGRSERAAILHLPLKAKTKTKTV
jgi:hypothetical protein